MRFFLSIFLVISILFANSQDSCVVKLSLNDCSNCYGGLCIIDDLPENTKKTLIVEESNKKISEYFITKHLELKTNYTYIFSDSLYNSLSSTPESQVFIYDKDQLVYDGVLGKLSSIPEIEKSILDTIFIMPDTIMVSNFKLLCIVNDYLVITDMIFGSVFIIDSKTGNIKDVLTPDFVDITKLQLSFGVDSLSLSVFNKLLPQIKATGNDKVKIQEAVSFRDNLLIPIYVPTPVYDTAARSLTLPSKPAYVLWNIEESKVESVLTTNTNSVSSGGVEYFFLTNCFPVGDESIIIQSQSRDSLNPVHLSSFSIDNDMLTLSDDLNFTLPRYYIETGLKTNMLNLFVKFPYVCTYLGGEVYNLESNEVITLPHNNDLFVFDMSTVADQSFKFRLIDAIIGKEGFELLYMNDQDQFILEETDKQGKVKSSTEVFQNFSSKVMDVTIQGPGIFIILTTDSNILQYKVVE